MDELTHEHLVTTVAQLRQRIADLEASAGVLDSVLDCIITMDAEGRVIEFNAAAQRTFGYTKADAIGRPLADLIIPPLLRDAHAAGLARYLATGEGRLIGKLIEMTAIRSDGSDIPVELAITASRSDKFQTFTGVLRDITERNRAQAAIRLRAQLSALGAAVGLSLTSTDSLPGALQRCAEALVTHLGAAFARIWTLNEREGVLELQASAGLYTHVNGPHGRVALGQFKIGRIAQDRQAHLTNDVIGDPQVSDQEWARREGMVAFAGHPLVVDGRVVGVMALFARHALSDAVISAMASVADHIALGIERHRSADALRTAEERMRFALESARVGIWDMDYTTGEHRWSETVESQYGVPRGTFGGTFEAFVERIHPDDRESVLETVGTAMKSGADFSTEHRVIWPDGTVRWLSGAGRVLLGEHGEPVRAVGITQDVTERHTLEERYRQAQKMEAIGRLAGGVAHDFNNLLTVILGYCELLLTDLDPNDPRHRDMEEIQKAGARAAGLTRQLLAFSRKQIVEQTQLDLNDVMIDMRAMLGRLLREDVKLMLGLRPELAPVTADRGQVEQIVMNLAVNAQDAMPRGGTLTLETTNVELDEHFAKSHPGVRPGQYVVLTVTDTGTGITPQVQARLFEPFFTTKEVGRGTGLGLATVLAIVTQSGGCVNVHSEVGKGSSFSVYFPRADAAEMAAETPSLVLRPYGGTETVLVVEDADGVPELTRRLLQRQGYTVLVAEKAEEAFQLFEQNPSIDLVLADVIMPGVSGPELASRLVERRPGLKVIYMSGYTDEAIAQHGVLKPGIAFLHKPFTSEALGRKIREVLDR
jgi:PAS domain S-box-containing protein